MDEFESRLITNFPLGRDEDVIRRFIRDQEKEGELLDPLSLV